MPTGVSLHTTIYGSPARAWGMEGCCACLRSLLFPIRKYAPFLFFPLHFACFLFHLPFSYMEQPSLLVDSVQWNEIDTSHVQIGARTNILSIPTPIRGGVQITLSPPQIYERADNCYRFLLAPLLSFIQGINERENMNTIPLSPHSLIIPKI